MGKWETSDGVARKVTSGITYKTKTIHLFGPYVDSVSGLPGSGPAHHFDIGMIKVGPRPGVFWPGEQVGFMGMAYSSYMPDNEYYLNGFPHDKPKFTHWLSAGKLRNDEPPANMPPSHTNFENLRQLRNWLQTTATNVIYTIDTTPGQDGAPVWYWTHTDAIYTRRHNSPSPSEGYICCETDNMEGLWLRAVHGGSKTLNRDDLGLNVVAYRNWGTRIRGDVFWSICEVIDDERLC